MKQHHLTTRSTLVLLMSFMVTALAASGCKTQQQEPAIVPVPANSFMIEWQAPMEIGDDPIASLHVRSATLYAYTASNRGLWLGAESGRLLAINQLADPNMTVYPPVELDNRVVIPTTISFEAFSANGRLLASYPINSPIQSPGAGAGNSVFVGVSYPEVGRLAKFDFGETEFLRDWELYTSSGVTAAPAVYSGVVYAAGRDGRVWAITFNRSAVWSLDDYSFVTDAGVSAGLVADEYGVYVPSQDKKLYVLERSSGRIRWQYYGGMPLVDQPVVLGNVVYQLVPIATGDSRQPVSKQLVALNKTEGEYNRQPMWVRQGVRQILSADDQYVYVRSGRSTIVALDRETGEPVFQSVRGDLRIFATNLTSPMIYAATADGTVMAIRPVLRPGSTGELVQDTSTPRNVIAASAQ